MEICNICNKKFQEKESLEQHKNAVHKEKTKINFKRYFLIFGIIAAISIFSYTLYVRAQNPGKYDDFAKCLSTTGAVVYGNDFCSYTNQQLNSFGKSKEYLNYVKCFDNEGLCNSKGVKITPTWEINGKTYAGIQSFEYLSELSGCEL